jgi:hypothetical protein
MEWDYYRLVLKRSYSGKVQNINARCNVISIVFQAENCRIH